MNLKPHSHTSRKRLLLALAIPIIICLSFFALPRSPRPSYPQGITAIYHGDPTVTITYNTTSTNTNCLGNNPYGLLLEGCVVPAIVDEYANDQNNPVTLGTQVFIGALLIIPDIAILINSENALIFLIILGAGIGVLGYLLPSDIINLAQGLLMVCIGVILWYAFKPKGS